MTAIVSAVASVLIFFGSFFAACGSEKPSGEGRVTNVVITSTAATVSYRDSGDGRVRTRPVASLLVARTCRSLLAVNRAWWTGSSCIPK